MNSGTQSPFTSAEFTNSYLDDEHIEFGGKLHKRQSDAILAIGVTNDYQLLLQTMKSYFGQFNANIPLDNLGNTAVHYCARFGRLDMVQSLLSHGLDLHAKNAYDHTALLSAAEGDTCFTEQTFPDFLEILRDQVYHFDTNHQSLLHHFIHLASNPQRRTAVKYYIDCILSYLLDMNDSAKSMHDAATNLRTTRRNVEKGDEAYKFLGIIEKNTAFINSKDIFGRTALHLGNHFDLFLIVCLH